MKFKEFLKNLNEYAKENPESLELDVITSKDDGGNGYNLVNYTPEIGIFEDYDFIPKTSLKEWSRSEKDINAICVN